MKYFVIIAFIAILVSLGCALYFMLRGGQAGQSRSRPMARSLAIRIVLSILLFLSILIAWKFGLIQPTGIPTGH